MVVVVVVVVVEMVAKVVVGVVVVEVEVMVFIYWVDFIASNLVISKKRLQSLLCLSQICGDCDVDYSCKKRKR